MGFTLQVQLAMAQFVIQQLSYDLSSNAGLAMVGQYLGRVKLGRLVDKPFPVRVGIPNSDVLRCYLGLLCLGKSDFEAVEGWRGDVFVQHALGLGAVPSSSTLRQRLDARGSGWFELVDRINGAVLALRVGGHSTDFGLLANGYCPVDIDTFAMDNGETHKEGVGRTYGGVEGYCPLAAYLGTHGYCLQLALRPGVQYSARETEYNLEYALPMAARLTPAPLLVRADSGFCSTRLMKTVLAERTASGRALDFLIKWNPRATPVETLAT